MQKALGRRLIAPLLDEDVQHNAVLIDGPPQPVALAVDLEQHLVQMPLVAGLRSASAQVGRVARPECVAPVPDGLVADDDPALGEEFLDLPKLRGKRK